MSYRQWFDHGSWYKSDNYLDSRCYVADPDKQNDLKTIQWLDKQAAAYIEQYAATLARVQEYRAALAARYAELVSMPYRMQLELTRHKQYQGPVTYWLRLNRVYADGHVEHEQETKYPGTERHKAIAEFERMKKQRPGIEAVKDIAKGKWER
ncbi:hypothetical protein ACTQ33_01140 [Candidatus Avoscillospira sp. LCP25S3_F1]|uniref:hypothetical protein n=1 Tax=Candidatus Avoscillospira sp. LCP25S3_F1 TaxID=3438825 RepID=UPI003F8DE753